MPAVLPPQPGPGHAEVERVRPELRTEHPPHIKQLGGHCMSRTFVKYVQHTFIITEVKFSNIMYTANLLLFITAVEHINIIKLRSVNIVFLNNTK